MMTLVLMEAHEEKKVSRKPLENNKETKFHQQKKLQVKQKLI